MGLAGQCVPESTHCLDMSHCWYRDAVCQQPLNHLVALLLMLGIWVPASRCWLEPSENVGPIVQDKGSTCGQGCSQGSHALFDAGWVYVRVPLHVTQSKLARYGA